jgi:hypothetical protein
MQTISAFFMMRESESVKFRWGVRADVPTGILGGRPRQQPALDTSYRAQHLLEPALPNA